MIHEKNVLTGELREKEEYNGLSIDLSAGKVVDAGDVLMKFSEGSCSADSSEVRVGELGVILYVDKRDTNE